MDVSPLMSIWTSVRVSSWRFGLPGIRTIEPVQEKPPELRVTETLCHRSPAIRRVRSPSEYTRACRPGGALPTVAVETAEPHPPSSSQTVTLTGKIPLSPYACDAAIEPRVQTPGPPGTRDTGNDSTGPYPQ